MKVQLLLSQVSVKMSSTMASTSSSSSLITWPSVYPLIWLLPCKAMGLSNTLQLSGDYKFLTVLRQSPAGNSSLAFTLFPLCLWFLQVPTCFYCYNGEFGLLDLSNLDWRKERLSFCISCYLFCCMSAPNMEWLCSEVVNDKLKRKWNWFYVEWFKRFM